MACRVLRPLLGLSWFGLLGAMGFDKVIKAVPALIIAIAMFTQTREILMVNQENFSMR
jgi:hypothetical protein